MKSSKFLTLLFIFVQANLFAVDFGVKGQTYSIVETNLLDFIYEKLNQYNKEGRVKDLQKKFILKVKSSIYRPKGQKLGKAIENKVFYFDPTLELKKDISNEKGQIIAKAGTRINPLDIIGLSKKLIFINGDIKTEIVYAKNILANNGNTKIILVQGNIYDVNSMVGTPVYFDQEQRLINRFGIKRTPSVIEQEGKLLKISEVVI